MGSIDDAVADAVERREWDRVTELLGSNWSQLMTSSREMLRLALNALPEDIIGRDARWSAAKDYANFLPAAGEARPVRYQHTPSHPTQLLDTLASLTSRSASQRFLGNFADAERLVREAHQTIADVSDETLVPVRGVMPELRLQWGISLFFDDALPDALRGYERTYDEALGSGNVRMAVEAAGSVALIMALMGDMTEAATWLARIPEYDEAGTPDSVRTPGLIARSLAAASALDVVAARAALDAAPANDIAPEQWALRAYVEAKIAATWGEPLAQIVALQAEKNSHLERTWSNGTNQWLIACAEAELHLAAGNADAARAAVADVRRGRGELGAEYVDVILAWSALWLGDVEQAVVIAAPYLTAHAGHLRTSVHMLAIAAIANLRLGQREDAAVHFSACLALAAQQNMPIVLTRIGVADRDALFEASGQAVPAVIARLVPSGMRPRETAPHVRLSRREKVVLAYLVRGFGIDAIAEAESVSRNTVKSQTRTLFRKLGTSSRDDAVKLAIAHPALLG
jgi:DNA-binding CsgD family transcriptional regulator